MNISIRQLQAFVAVAESRSFAKASEQIHLSQPALSISIKNLETAVGGSLLVRTTRSLSLSPEGEEFLPVARRLLRDWETAFNDLHNLFQKQRGKLSVAAMPSFAATLLPEILAEFAHQFPNINVLVDDIVAEQVHESVLSGRVEIGITFKPEDLNDVEFIPLFTDKFVAALPADHPLAVRKQVTWTTISDHPLVLLQKPSSIRRLIEATAEEQQLDISVEMEAHQLATLGKMVASGLGISIVPSLSIEQMQVMGAVCKPLQSPAISREVGILVRADKPQSTATKAMMGAVVDYFADY